MTYKLLENEHQSNVDNIVNSNKSESCVSASHDLYIPNYNISNTIHNTVYQPYLHIDNNTNSNYPNDLDLKQNCDFENPSDKPKQEYNSIKSNYINEYDTLNYMIHNENDPKYVTPSIELDHVKISKGLNNILTLSMKETFINNLSNIVKLNNINKVKSEDNDVLFINKITKNMSNDISEIFLKTLESIKHVNKDSFINIIHLTGITNKNDNEREEIKKNIIIKFKINNNFKTNNIINIEEIIKYILKDSYLTLELLVEKVHKIFINSLENILGIMMNNMSDDKKCLLYNIAYDITDFIVLGNNINKNIESFANTDITTILNRIINIFGKYTIGDSSVLGQIAKYIIIIYNYILNASPIVQNIILGLFIIMCVVGFFIMKFIITWMIKRIIS